MAGLVVVHAGRRASSKVVTAPGLVFGCRYGTSGAEVGSQTQDRRPVNNSQSQLPEPRYGISFIGSRPARLEHEAREAFGVRWRLRGSCPVALAQVRWAAKGDVACPWTVFACRVLSLPWLHRWPSAPPGTCSERRNASPAAVPSCSQGRTICQLAGGPPQARLAAVSRLAPTGMGDRAGRTAARRRRRPSRRRRQRGPAVGRVHRP
jgi:hypothetical protein